MLMRYLGYGIGHKDQTKHIQAVFAQGADQGRGLPASKVARGESQQARPLRNFRDAEAGDAGSSEDEHSDGESEDSELNSDDEDGL